MEIIKILGIGLTTAFAALLLKQAKPEMAMLVTVIGSLLMVLSVVSMLGEVFTFFSQFASKTGIDQGLFTTVLKIVGLGYLTEFTASICTDAGNSSTADKILFGGKIAIMIVALPILTNLLDIIIGLLP